MDVSENASSKYNLKLKYGGYFRKVKNSCRKRYCFGYQKSVYIDTSTYMIEDLFEEAKKRYPSNRGLVLSMWFIDKSVLEHPFTQLVTMDDFKLMLTMYELEKDVTIYVTRVDDQIVVVDEVAHESVNEANEDEDSEYCLSVESYHSKLSTDDESESDENVEGETHSQSKKTPAMNKRSIFSNVVEFRRALNHYEIVKTFVGTHSCIRSNKGGNKLASQGWVASVVTDRLKSDGDVSVTVLQKWTMNTYNVDVPYLQVFRGELRYQPTLDLLDSIREKIMAQFDKKRTILKTWKSSIVPNAKGYLKKISKNLGEYEVSKSGENRVEVKYKGRRWEVLLDEQQCTCRVWQVKGLPCYHAAAFIALKKDNWDRYVDPYFTVEKYKSAYDSEIAPMPAKDEWVCVNMDEKIYPPSIKRPSGRPRKNRIKSHDESKKRHKCSRCGEYGHHGKTCKNSASQAPNDDQTSIVKKGRGKKTNGHED
ncbi:hypothetical protein QVD17_00100 [Tagetes erecta]|uniref:SWIM-type domain-containing protein n=1 Tax=Tagetes erecta TaxID=13708 RepID=A0AAD8L859_TARER|nr:hypothetical protein QVD17_00100 [Tagetes erecta]